MDGPTIIAAVSAELRGIASFALFSAALIAHVLLRAKKARGETGSVENAIANASSLYLRAVLVSVCVVLAIGAFAGWFLNRMF